MDSLPCNIVVSNDAAYICKFLVYLVTRTAKSGGGALGGDFTTHFLLQSIESHQVIKSCKVRNVYINM